MNNVEKMYKILLSPHVSELTNRIAAYNQYVFKVLSDATKQEIKKAVEMMFKVEVVAVKVINVKGKVKKFGSKQGRRKDWKKAYVRLKQGQTIDVGAIV